jgi:hypothetical protein
MLGVGRRKGSILLDSGPVSLLIRGSRVGLRVQFACYITGPDANNKQGIAKV